MTQIERIVYDITVLYAEDDESIRESTARILSRMIKNVITAIDGQDAIDKFKENYENIDLIITDISMPFKNGLDFVEDAKKLKPNIYTILTTAFDHPEYFQKAIDLNVDKYIIKPVSLIKLKESIIKFYNTYSLQKELLSQKVILDEYKHAIDASSIVSKTDKKGYITFVNDLFCEVSGYAREELIGKPHNIVRHPDMPKEVFKNMWETILNKKIWRGRVKNRKKNGDFYIVETTITPILDSKGEIKEFISIRQDVTDFVKVGRQLLEEKEKQKEMEKTYFEDLNKTKDSFLVVFTHELKTPLNAIINFASFASKKIAKTDISSKQDIMEMLDVVKSNGRDMLEIVNNILDISRLKANKLQFIYTEFNLNDIIKEILHKYSSLLEQESVQVTFDKENDSLTMLKSDKNRVKQLISNLFSNSIKYGDGIIHISTKLTNSKLIFTIEDNGSGIKNKDGVFELFEQEQTDDIKRTAKGTGVGLHFVKLLANGLNIEIKLEDSEELGGAKFILIFNQNN
ncbi:MAG: response regulator [Campylobacterales bacterium]|nr:response regulator [Campylobacterales bacterium]